MLADTQAKWGAPLSPESTLTVLAKVAKEYKLKKSCPTVKAGKEYGSLALAANAGAIGHDVLTVDKQNWLAGAA